MPPEDPASARRYLQYKELTDCLERAADGAGGLEAFREKLAQELEKARAGEGAGGRGRFGSFVGTRKAVLLCSRSLRALCPCNDRDFASPPAAPTGDTVTRWCSE